ncbi:ead/Ea22-like family protein [Klebsiella pneumoniae]|uniref:ead/Ea22-like family protein n=1 Tax=Klebsiella pneumoniae TaxID=573 RepID=UPI001E57DB17|nr:ead/Ea22-like family protein [Klebsiella pneumoniae]MCD5866108.1 ead/Ea22-like family protein [Klebsiella pneumoniae]
MTDITELAQREKFEAWFKSSFHPDKTGPYIKDQLYFAWKAAGAELVEALEKAQQRIASQREYYEGVIADGGKRIAELKSRTVKLPPCVDDLRGIGMVMSADAVVEALISYGIKVEDE